MQEQKSSNESDVKPSLTFAPSILSLSHKHTHKHTQLTARSVISQSRRPGRPTWARRARGPDPAGERRHAVHFWATVPRCCGNPLKPLPGSAAGSYCSSLGFTSTDQPVNTSIFSTNISIYQSVFSIAGLLWRQLILTPESPPPPPPVFFHNLFKRSNSSGAGLHI